MTQQTEVTTDNGVDLAAILDARNALTDAPEAAQFTWRAECDWINGVHSKTTITGFYGLGEEQERSKEFGIDADHPPQFSASDEGATPVEIVLSGLASCLMAGLATVAQNRDIQLRSAKARVEGDMDLQGIMGINSDVRNGFRSIRVEFEIDADATPDEVAALVAQSQKRSAVFDIITNPSLVHVTIK
ncbi:osmotically inducible protein C [Ruegeria sp. ANG-S4]|uniref:OsmC family protein n=1 Tax=Ruegeria sp. ANG-S4 TaxID=1577904 RepID=UPI00057E3145|nr:OsmC family protein [Ruegeria sp. ANG-S4]KIC40486.1 osmotically inducible protein C [Ruegeria sp. ANG-S4]